MRCIQERADAVRARQQRQWVWNCLSWGLVAGGAAGCLIGALRMVAPVWFPWTAVAGSVIAGPVAGLLFAVVRPCALREAAASIDRSCGLKDRISTALAFLAQGEHDSPIRQLQVADAAVHVTSIDPLRVAPIAAPKSWLWGLGLTAAAVTVGFLSNPAKQVVAAVVTDDVTDDVVVAQASRVADQLDGLEEFNLEQPDPEIEQLLKELAAKIDELKQPGLDPKEALEKLSEMEAALRQQQEQLANPASEAALVEVGEALSLAEQFQTAGQAMSQGEMDKAAEELAKLELPNLDRQTERSMLEKLDHVQQNSGDGPRRTLSESLGQVSAGLSQADRSRFKDGIEGLAGECKRQGRRQRLSDLLRKQCQCLAECKGECEAQCKNNAMSNKKGGKNWGLGASGNEFGDKTAKLTSAAQMHITGQESDSGDVDVDSMSSPEQRQEAVRQYREQAERYEQLSESVLDSEPIPLGHRQTIRRYFELIRPQNGEMDAVMEASTGSE